MPVCVYVLKLILIIIANNNIDNYVILYSSEKCCLLNVIRNSSEFNSLNNYFGYPMSLKCVGTNIVTTPVNTAHGCI